MTQISELLKEAKPLYFKRKRQRRMIKNAIATCSMCLVLGVLSFNVYQPKVVLSNSEVYSYLYDEDSYEEDFNLMAMSESIFPVDEYGLIQVKQDV